MYCWHNEMIRIYVLRIYSDIMYICSFGENYYMCTQKHNARLKPASQPSIHFEQSDTLCSYCSEWLLLLLLCCSVFGEIFFGYILFRFIIHLCTISKFLWKFSSFVFWPWTPQNANRANTNEKVTTTTTTTMTTSAKFLWITFVSYRLHSTLELNFFRQSDWVSVLLCVVVMSYALLSTAEISTFYAMQRWRVFHHLMHLCSILFWAVQLSSVRFPVSLFFIVSLIGCLYLCGRREIQIR